MDDSEDMCDSNLRNISNMLMISIHDTHDIDSNKYIVEEGLSISHTTVQQILETINIILISEDTSNIEDRLLSKLSNLLTVLETLTSLLQQLIHLDQIDLDDFESLPKIIGTILLDIFNHCKESEKTYSLYITHVGKVITNVFKKSHELQTAYLSVLSKTLKFDVCNDHHLDILEEVLDNAVSIGEIVITLDVKTMAEEWKGYTVLCEKYADWLKDKFIHHRATKILCDELEKNISLLITNQALNTRDMTRSLKISHFILKILIKITEVFGGFIAENLNHIVSSISYVYRYSVPNLIYLKINPTIIEGIRSHIQIGAELLLTKLISDPYFKRDFLMHPNFISKNDSPNLGYLFLCIALTKIILQEDDETRNEWADDIVSIVLNIVNFYHADLLKSYKFDSDIHKNVSLYDYLLLNCTCLVISVKDLSVIEENLLQSILKPDIWSSMLAFDIWIIAAKYGSSEFICQQLLYLIPIFNDFIDRGMLKNTPQYCYLCHLILGLFKLLPDKHKIKINEKYPCQNFYYLWNAIGLHNLPISAMQMANETILRNSLLLSTDICDVISNDYSEIKNELSLLSLLCYEIEAKNDMCKQLVLRVAELWKSCFSNDKMTMSLKQDKMTIFGMQWFYDIVVLLTNVTEKLIPFIDENLWLQILQIASSLIVKTTSIIKFSFLKLILNFVSYKIKAGVENDQLTTFVAWTFQILLKDHSDLIHVIALLEFEYFVFNTINEHLVIRIILGQPEIKEKIKNLILKKQFQNFNYKLIDEFSHKSKFNFKHKCAGSDRTVYSKNYDNGDQLSKEPQNFDYKLVDKFSQDDKLYSKPKCESPKRKFIARNDKDNQVSNHLKIIKEELIKLVNTTNRGLNDEQMQELSEIEHLFRSFYTK